MGFIWVDDKEDDDKFKAHLEKETTSAIDAATTALTNSNTGLKADITKLKKKVKEKENIDVEEYNNTKQELDSLKKKNQEGETEVEKQARIAKEQHKADMDRLQARIDKMDKKDVNNTIVGEINSGLGKVGVKSALMNAAQKIIRADVTVTKNDDGDSVCMIGDKTITEHINDWIKTDEGKNFAVAPSNSGGGSGGSGGSGDDDSLFDPKSKSYNVTKQILLKKKDPEKYERLKEKFKNQ